MESPLLQYAREENQRASQLQASMGAEAIGFELAQQKMSMDKEAKDRAEKMGIEAALYQAAPRGSTSRIEIGGRWADLLGIPREKITGVEEDFNTDLEMLFELQRQTKKDPLQAGAMKEHQQRMYAKYGGYPAEPEKKYDVKIPGVGAIELGGEKAADVGVKLEDIKTTAATAAANRLASPEGGPTYTKLEGAVFQKYLQLGGMDKLTKEEQEFITNKRQADPVWAQAVKMVNEDMQLAFLPTPDKTKAIDTLYRDLLSQTNRFGSAKEQKPKTIGSYVRGKGFIPAGGK